MKTDFIPKVSIIIPVYNGSNYLRESIDAALAQNYGNLEVIVVNDGSRDGGKTDAIASSYGNRIRYFYKENGGVSTALNFGIQQMKGEYFSWLSHDDLYSNSKISDGVELLSRYDVVEREKMIAFTSGYYIDSESKKVKQFPNLFQKGKIYSGTEVVMEMLRGNTLNGCCMLIPKRAFNECGVFDEKLRYSQDALMWYIMFSSGYKLVSDNKLNVMYRLHRNQASKLRRDLFLHDTILSSKVLIPLLGEQKEFLYLYAKRIAKLDCRIAVNLCKDYARQKELFSPVEYLKLDLFCCYGKVRNFIKTIRNRLLR